MADRTLASGTARPTPPAAVPPEGAATGVVSDATEAAAGTTAGAVGAIAARVKDSAA